MRLVSVWTVGSTNSMPLSAISVQSMLVLIVTSKACQLQL